MLETLAAPRLGVIGMRVFGSLRKVVDVHERVDVEDRRCEPLSLERT